VGGWPSCPSHTAYLPLFLPYQATYEDKESRTLAGHMTPRTDSRFSWRLSSPRLSLVLSLPSLPGDLHARLAPPNISIWIFRSQLGYSCPSALYIRVTSQVQLPIGCNMICNTLHLPRGNRHPRGLQDLPTTKTRLSGIPHKPWSPHHSPSRCGRPSTPRVPECLEEYSKREHPTTPPPTPTIGVRVRIKIRGSVRYRLGMIID